MKFLLTIITLTLMVLVIPNQLNANNTQLTANTSESLTVIPPEWRSYPKIYSGGIIPNGCKSAICTEDEEAFYTKVIKNIKFETIICKEAICANEALPTLPDLLNWKIVERDPTKPLGDYCKDAICIQTMGKVMGETNDSEADLERLRRAAEIAEREKAEAKKRFAEAKKAEEELKRKQKEAEDRKRANKEKIAKAKAKADQQFKESQEFEVLRREEEARITKLQEDLDAKTKVEEFESIERKKEQDRINYQKTKLKEEIERDKSDSLLATFELNMFRSLYDSDLKESQNLLREAERDVYNSKRELESQQRTARDAIGVYQAERGVNPFGRYYLDVCRGAGTSCATDSIDKIIIPRD